MCSVSYSLPIDILTVIFDHMSSKDRYVLSFVSKEYHEYFLIKSLNLTIDPITSPCFKSIKQIRKNEVKIATHIKYIVTTIPMRRHSFVRFNDIIASSLKIKCINGNDRYSLYLLKCHIPITNNIVISCNYEDDDDIVKKIDINTDIEFNCCNRKNRRNRKEIYDKLHKIIEQYTLHDMNRIYTRFMSYKMIFLVSSCVVSKNINTK